MSEKKPLKKLSLKTIKQYESNLNKLIENKIDFKKMKLPDLEEYFEKYDLGNSTQKGYISAVLWALRDDDSRMIDGYRTDLRNKLINLDNIITDISIKKNQTLKEQEKFVSWHTILKVYDQLGKNLDITNVSMHTDYVILSLYILIPPRRIVDYTNMYLDNTINISENSIIRVGKIYDDDYVNKFNWVSGYKEISDKQNPDKNYYVKNSKGNFFVMNDYKTSTHYGHQILEVGDLLASAIDRYIQLKKISNGEKIFESSIRGKIKKVDSITWFTSRLTLLFMSIIKKPISCSTLRHIFIKNLLQNNPTSYQKAMIARVMSHDLEQQNKYEKNGIDIDISDSDIAKGIIEYNRAKLHIKKIIVHDVNVTKDIFDYKILNSGFLTKLLIGAEHITGLIATGDNSMYCHIESIILENNLKICDMIKLKNQIICEGIKKCNVQIKKMSVVFDQIVNAKLIIKSNNIIPRDNIEQNNDKLMSHMKAGRPHKYKTDDEKKQARLEAKKRWYKNDPQNIEKIKLYNKLKYEKNKKKLLQ